MPGSGTKDDPWFLKTPPGTSLCFAEIVIVPPASTVAPDATVTVTVGLSVA